MGLLLVVLLLLVFVPAVLYLIGRFTNRIRVPASRKNDEVTSRESMQQSKELQEAQGEILRLRKQLQRVEEERDALIKASR